MSATRAAALAALTAAALRADGQHLEAPGYRWSDADPHFCLDCHPQGTR